MKTIKCILLAITLLIGINLQAQDGEVGMKAMTEKNFEYEKDGKMIPYEIKIFENREFKVKLKEEDKNKLNQERVLTPARVSKLIFVDNDADKDFDRYIVLRYPKDANDSFELEPTKRGFAVKVNKRYMEYIFGEGVYFVNNEDRDYFIVEEFNAM
ncbi:MAG: hypothetical protein CL613_10445 [Aquimarina sp.]|nr:hypothetical protein [Aquimarina sp.]